jgi:hypothetical protein
MSQRERLMYLLMLGDGLEEIDFSDIAMRYGGSLNIETCKN